MCPSIFKLSTSILIKIYTGEYSKEHEVAIASWLLFNNSHVAAIDKAIKGKY